MAQFAIRPRGPQQGSQTTSMIRPASTVSNWGKYRNRQGLVTRAAIRRVAEQIASRFSPRQIILFGSYATDRARPDSDVDILVVMPARNEIDQSLRIEESLDAPFSLDLIVRTPKTLARRLKEGDWFLREVMEQGKVLYEDSNEGVGA
jgi:uncharacterized protein